MTERFRELDGLRGVASVLVVAAHFTLAYDLLYPGVEESPVTAAWGAFGVQLFFMISGFVILMTAWRSRRPTDFVISRLSRLYPAYWVALTLSIILAVAFSLPGHDIGWLNRALNYAMIQRWFLVPNQDQVYWTLALEMQFYVLVFLLLVATRCRLTSRMVAVAASAWMAVALVISIWAGPFSRGLDPQNVSTPVKMVLNVTLAEWAPLFSAGMFAFLARRESAFRWFAIAAGALAVAEGALLHSWIYASFDLAVVTAFLVVAFRPSTAALLWRPIQFYGKISYSLYITHNLGGTVVMHLTMPYVGRVASMVLAFIVVTLLAWGVHEIGEVRLSRALKKYLSSLQKPLAAPASTAS